MHVSKRENMRSGGHTANPDPAAVRLYMLFLLLSQEPFLHVPSCGLQAGQLMRTQTADSHLRDCYWRYLELEQDYNIVPGMASCPESNKRFGIQRLSFPVCKNGQL